MIRAFVELAGVLVERAEERKVVTRPAACLQQVLEIVCLLCANDRVLTL